MHVLEFIDLMSRHGANPAELALILDNAFEGFTGSPTKTLTSKELFLLSTVKSAVESYARSMKIPKEHIGAVQVQVFNPLHMRRYSPGSAPLFKYPKLFVKREFKELFNVASSLPKKN